MNIYTVQQLFYNDTLPLTEMEVINLCYQVRPIVLHQSMLLELEAPINICGKKI